MVITGSRPNMRYIKKSKRTVEASGIEVMFSPGLLRCIRDGVVNFKDGEFREPEVRAEELRWALRVNPDLIICATGGYGNARIIPLLDFREIKDANIPVMGFSDCTSLVNLWASLGVPAYIGPCFEESETLLTAIRAINEQSFPVLSSRIMNFIKFSHEFITLKGLFGGNLTSFSALSGIPEVFKIINSAGAFIFEDIYNEYGRKGSLYAFESTLDIIEVAGLFNKTILWGTVTGVPDLISVIKKRTKTCAVVHVPFGHHSDRSTLPIPVGFRTEVVIEGKNIRIYTKGGIL